MDRKIPSGDNRTVLLSSDSFGRATQTGIANTATIGYTYNNGLLNTITRTDSQSKAQTYTFGYDAFGNTTTQTYTYDDQGQLLTATDGTKNISYTYNLGAVSIR